MRRWEIAGGAPSRRRLIKAAAALVAGMGAPAVLRVTAALAAYPERPVKIVVANTPGGPSDIVARILAAGLQEATGKTFIIENRGGAGGNIGMGYAAHVEPDGYTLLLPTNAYSINAGLYDRIPYDPLKDFVAIADIAGSPNTFAVKPELGVATMKEFIALVQSDPAKFNVAVPPIGTTPQLQAEVLKIRAGLTKMASIVFSGGGEALQAMLSGTVQLSSGALAPVQPHIKTGAVKCLAITGDARWPDLPDVPTMLDQGFKDFVFATDCAFVAPAKTPIEVVRWLETESLRVLAQPQMKDKLFRSGFLIRAKDGKACMERLVKEVAIFSDIITQAGIQKM